MHRSRFAAAALAVLALAACGSPAGDRADACEQALNQHLHVEGIRGFVVDANTQDAVTAHVDVKNKLGDPAIIKVSCAIDGDKVTIKTDPEF